MAPLKKSRKYDIVIIGATGYTGVLTAEYLASNLPKGLKWAIAGRSRDKLDALAKKLKNLSPDQPQPAVEVVSFNDRTQVDTLVGNAKVCISIVTYWKESIGEVVIQACIEKKTDYLDLAGDTPLLRSWIQKYHKAAESAGVALIHVCGLNSTITDILTWTAVRELRTSASLKTKEAILSVKEFDPNASGGTIETVMNNLSLDRDVLEESNRPWTLSPVEGVETSPSTNLFGLRRDPDLGLLSASSFSGSGNRAVIHRAWGLLRDRDRDTDADYGPRFQYNEYEKASSALSGILSILNTRLLLAALGSAPVRAIAKWFLPAPGEGPDVERSKNARIAMELVAVPDVEGGDDDARRRAPRARSVFSYPAGSYQVTAMVLVQGASSLLYARELGGGYAGGCLTPSFLGDDFVQRIRKAGAVLKSEILPASAA